MIAIAVALLAQAAASLTVNVGNVRDDAGTVRVAVCPKERFLSEACPFHGEARAQAGITVVTVPGLPPGDYAVQAFHDENDNDRVDRGLFGIPKEGVGFSRDARIVFGPPKWAEAKISHGADPQEIQFALRYFFGPGSPTAWRKAHPPR